MIVPVDLARSPLPSLFGLSGLVVAEDATVQRAARTVAFRLGLAVECADGGRAAIASSRAHGVDAVILDRAMRELDALGVAVAIRALDAHLSGLPIVALADPADTRRIGRCAEIGIDGWIDRSVEPAALAAALGARFEPARSATRPARAGPPASCPASSA
ncbi:MAG: response regulator [Burkholderiales bacterium]